MNQITEDIVIASKRPYSSIKWTCRVTRPEDGSRQHLILFIPGQGEMGSDPSKLSRYGPHAFYPGQWDGSCQVGEDIYYPIIVSAISTNIYMSGTEVIDLILELKALYNPLSVNCTGLSQGGFATTSAIWTELEEGDETGMKLINSIAAFHGISDEISGGGTKVDSDNAWGDWAAYVNGKFFGLEGNSGDNFRNVWKVSKPMNEALPGSAYFGYTSAGGGGHNGWDVIYNPANKNWKSTPPDFGPYNTGSQAGEVAMGTYQVGWNIYEWLVAQGLGVEAPIDPLPPIQDKLLLVTFKYYDDGSTETILPE